MAKKVMVEPLNNKKTKLLVQINIEEELPENEGIYLVETVDGEMFQANYHHQFSFHQEFMDCSFVKYWYKEYMVNCELKLQ